MRLLDRIMRTNANSRSLRCGQAFICHALAAAHRRVQPRTVWNLTYAIRRLRVVPHSRSLFLLGHLRAQPSLALFLAVSSLFPRCASCLEFPSDLGDRVPCHNYLPPSSRAGTFVHGLHCRCRLYFSINYAAVP